MSRKIDAASSGAALMSCVLPQPLEVVHREAGEDHEPEDRVDQLTVRDPDEDQHDPEHDQRDQREEEDARERRRGRARVA